MAEGLPKLPPAVPQRAISLPAQLAYADRGLERRPAFVRAIGVCSITIASLSILANLVSGIYAGAVLVLIVAAPTLATLRNFGLGLNHDTAASIVADAASRQNLSAGQQASLTAFLEDCGGMAFNSVAYQKADPKKQLRGAGMHLRGTSASPNVAYFTTRDGRLDVGEDFVFWIPGGGTPTPRPLNQQQINSTLQAMGNAAMTPPTPAQSKSLADALSLPQQGFIDPNKPAAAQIGGSPPQSSGAFLAADQTGALLHIRNPTPSSTPATNPVATQFSKWSLMPKAPAIAALVESVLAFALAIFLLVIGIGMLRTSRRGRRLHYWYVWLKLPLAAMFAVFWYHTADHFVRSVQPAASASSEMGGPGIIVFTIAGLISAAYAIALLFLLRARTLRAYFEKPATPTP